MQPIHYKIIITALSSILAAVAIRERYHLRLWQRIFPQKEADYHYSQNEGFYELIDYYKAYSKQADIVMLGNSIFGRVNWDELLNRNDIANRGIGGDVTEGVLNRLATVYSVKPKICFIEIGINDIEFKVRQETILDNYRLIIDSLRANNIVVIPSLVLPVTDYYPSSKTINQGVAGLNERLGKMFAEKNLPFIDLRQAFAPEGTLTEKYARKDGIHLTAEAYMLWKVEIEKHIHQTI